MFDDSRPIFMQLADQLADQILRGRYIEGEAVPSTNELAALHRINPATAGKALTRLVEAEILVKRRGIGMFVADGAAGRISHERQADFVTDFVRPLVREARTLGLTRADVSGMVTRAFAADDAVAVTDDAGSTETG